jgi:hypothetical protein
MAIAIPAIVDANLAAIQASLRPVQDAATGIASSAVPPYGLGNRIADLLRDLTGLIDVTGLTGVGVHTAADATNNIAVAAAATDLATAQTLLNAMRDGTGEAGGGMAAHFLIVGASEHIGADVTSVITAAAATNLATAATLANDLKTQFNLHLALNGATGHYGPELTNIVSTPDATAVLAEVIALANDLRAKYNAHCANIDAGSVRSVIDNAAFTTANSLIGAVATFDGNVTAALAGLTATVVANGVNDLQFGGPDTLPAAPAVGDTFDLAYSGVDVQIGVLDGGKGQGAAQSNPYGDGRSMINAIALLVERLGGTMPSYFSAINSSEPYELAAGGWANPHSGGGARGHGGALLIADLLQVARDTVAAYTVPA